MIIMVLLITILNLVFNALMMFTMDRVVMVMVFRLIMTLRTCLPCFGREESYYEYYY